MVAPRAHLYVAIIEREGRLERIVVRARSLKAAEEWAEKYAKAWGGVVHGVEELAYKELIDADVF